MLRLQLRVLVTVRDAGSFSAAGRALGRVQLAIAGEVLVERARAVRRFGLARSDETLARSDWKSRTSGFILIREEELTMSANVQMNKDAQVWLITGSSRGLGRALAEAVLAAGHRLVATARNTSDLSALVQTYGDRVRPFALDVTNSDSAREAIAFAARSFGRIDVVVNNAGYANVNSFEDLPEDDFRAQMETNFFGVVNVTRAALPVMRQQRSGHILQISSIGGRTTSAGLSAYQSAKWAVGGFSEVVAKEVAPFGVKVTVVEPGGMRTDWAGSSMRVDELREEYKSTVGWMSNVRGNADIMRGDPVKIARALVALVAEPEPPMHLLIGTDAFAIAASVLDARAKEDAKWKHVSTSTDFDGVVPFGDLALGKAHLDMKE